jgi:hypothetical protein
MNTGFRTWSHRRAQTILLAAALMAAATASAAPIPPPDFRFIVTQGGTAVPGCTPFPGSPFGGTCGSETSGPGYAATSGGIGTPSYLPLTPGGTVLGTGTAVDALSDWSSGSTIHSRATLIYSFEATGPASVEFIPIDVLSTGLLSVVGDATANLSLVIRDQGTDANIPPGVPDPDPKGPLLDLTAHCAHGHCVSSWGLPGNLVTDLLCVVNGDNYTVSIRATTSAGRGWGKTPSIGSAILDPVIKLDPPSPTSCPLTVDPSSIRITTSPGTSTGVTTGVPEPSALSLAVLAGLGLLLAKFYRRGLRPSRSLVPATPRRRL